MKRNRSTVSEAEFLELVVEFAHLAIVHLLLLDGLLLDFVLIVLFGLDLSLLFKGFNDIFSSPAKVVHEVSNSASVSVGFDSENFESLRNDHSLLDVVWVWNSFKDLQPLKGSFSSSGLMWQHSSNDSPEHSRWGSEMLELSSWVSVVGQSQEFVECQVISEERSRENEFLAPHNDNFLASEQGPGNF